MCKISKNCVNKLLNAFKSNHLLFLKKHLWIKIRTLYVCSVKGDEKKKQCEYQLTLVTKKTKQ